jgi:hypothetical protein
MIEAVAGFDWDDGNREKCCKHGVTREEIESLFRGGTLRLYPDPAHSVSETRYLGIGRDRHGAARPGGVHVPGDREAAFDLPYQRPVYACEGDQAL